MFELDDLYVADLFIHDDNYNNDMINVGFYEKDKRKKSYKHLFSLFKKVGNSYICLENGNSYTECGYSYVKDITPFKYFISFKDYSIIKYGDINDILNLFKLIFSSNEVPMLDPSTMHFKLYDAYFCNVITTKITVIDKFVNYNTASTQINKRSYCYANTLSQLDDNALLSRSYKIDSYYIVPCVKLKTGLLNIYNNAFYPTTLKTYYTPSIICSFDKFNFSNRRNDLNEINELYKKSKAEGLTDAERKEQKILRQEYMELVRRNLRGQLNNIDIEQKDGTVINLGEKYGAKFEKKGN